MFSDLTHDATPLGITPSTPCTPTQSSNTTHSVRECFKVPEVVNISGSNGVQIGPVYYVNHGPRVAPSTGDGSDPRPAREDVVNMLKVTREVSDREKSLVSEHLGLAWKALGREMGYSSGQLDNIDCDSRRLQDKVYELLSIWHDRESSEASLAQITRLLMRIRAFDVVNKLHANLASS